MFKSFGLWISIQRSSLLYGYSFTPEILFFQDLLFRQQRHRLRPINEPQLLDVQPRLKNQPPRRLLLLQNRPPQISRQRPPKFAHRPRANQRLLERFQLHRPPHSPSVGVSKSWTNPIALCSSKPAIGLRRNATNTSLRVGIDLSVLQETECPNTLQKDYDAERMHRVGWTERIRRPRRAEWRGRCVTAGRRTLVTGATRSMWPTAASSTCTNLWGRQPVACDIVWPKLVRCFSSSCFLT